MNHEEYLQKLKELKSEFKIREIDLMKNFIVANNPYNVGDKVTDHIGSILIEKISFSQGFGGNKPCAVYTGVELKKDGNPNKRGTKREVWQGNVL